jgi:glucose 1-dehydrogenase
MSVIPGHRGSALIAESPDPPPTEGSVLAEGLLAGICGTDAEILLGQGQPPDGGHRLVIGHESLGRMLQAPPDAPVRPGDLVVGVVRRPDPVPCGACAAGHWDFCANGQYTERGIKGLDGYGATRWRVGPRFAVKVPDRLGAPSLRAGCRSARRRRSGLARRPDQPPRAAVGMAAGAHQAAR